MKKIKLKKKYIIILVSVIAILFLTCVIFVIPKHKEESKNIIGTWTTDGVTIYQFNENGIGKLIVPLSDYDFTYKIENDSLSIDFKNEKSIDSKYIYYFEEDNLILGGSNGKFIFKKLKEK